MKKMNPLKMIINSIVIVLCLYIYIYNPIFQIIDFGSIKILLAVSSIYLSFSGKLRLFILKFSKEIFITLLLIIYALLVEALSGPGGKGMMYRHFIWFFEGFIIPFFLLLFFKEYFIKYGLLNIIIITGFTASLITIFLILNPEINLIVRSNVIIDSLDTLTDTWTFRGFTIAENSSYSYGIVQGVILGFCLFKLGKNYLFLIPIITLFISILFNSRTGISVVIIAMILVIIYRQIKIKNIVFLLLILLGLFTIIDPSLFIANNTTTIEWGLDFFTQTLDFLSGKSSENTYGALFGDMFFLPENSIEFIFGTGENIFYDKYKSSDMGYIIQIFEGGMIYLLLMIFFLFVMYKKIIKTDKSTIYPLFFIVVILIANLKGNALFVSTGFFRLFTLYYVYIILKNHFTGHKSSINLSRF